jgi:uncharacterized protein
MQTSFMTKPDDRFLTFSGRRVDRLAPLPEDHVPEDIALSLSHLCRFGGHVRSFYSVGEHSIHVSEQLERFYPALPAIVLLSALLHDASEGTLTDVITPLKAILPAYKRLEAAYEATIAERFGLPFPFPPQIKELDTRLCVNEALQLLPCDQQGYWRAKAVPIANLVLPDPRFCVSLAGGEVITSHPPLVRKAFLRRWNDLRLPCPA